MKKILYLILSIIVLTTGIIGCNKSADAKSYENIEIASAKSSKASSSSAGKTHSRNSAPHCLVPKADKVQVFDENDVMLDYSNTKEGYVILKYSGKSSKVKLQITGPNNVTYTYNLSVNMPKEEVFPLQSKNGKYLISVFENIEGNKYATVFTKEIDVSISNEFGPFLYPNQYCTFSDASKATKKASELAVDCKDDLEVISNVYNFIISNIKYDYTEAENVQSGYIPDVDEVLSTKKGICLDYASLMTAMLRSQNIPTRLEVGYAGNVYHAWISSYIKDIGWVNGIIKFDGKSWSLMDPTFASNTKEKDLKDFIGDGSNYTVKYVY